MKFRQKQGASAPPGSARPPAGAGAAADLSFLAISFVATLWIWSVPFLALSLIGGFLIIKWPMLSFVTKLALGMAFCFFFASWFFRWYFIVVGLMIGKTGMAATKRKELQRRSGV